MITKLKTIVQLGLITTLISTTSIAYAKNVALLVGISDYKNLEKEDLDGPKHDVQALRNVLIEQWEFRPEDITTLIDSQASHQGILNALNALERRTQSGDEILIYFSGHGTSIYDEGGVGNSLKDGLSSNSGAFVPYDLNVQKIEKALLKGDIESAVKNNFITGQYHLKPIIQKLEKDRFVTGIIDACFSEHSFRSVKEEGLLPNRILPFSKISPRKLEAYSDSNTSRFNDDKYPYHNTITIAASSKAQPAKDINLAFLNKSPNTTFDNKPHGLFSDLLIRILSGEIEAGGNDGIISYTDLENAMKLGITKYPISEKELQTPHFQPLLVDSNNSNMMNRPLFGLNKSLTRHKVSNTRLKIKIDDPIAFKKVVDNSIFETTDEGLVDFIVTRKANDWQLSTGNGTVILTDATDYQLKNRINTAYWLKSHLTNKTDTTHMRVNALPEAAGNVFKAGDEIQFAVSFDKPSTLLVFNITSQGDINILYPINSTENKMLVANQLKTLPEDDKIHIQAPFGQDQVIFIALSEPLNESELNTISKLNLGSNSTLTTPEIKTLSNIIKKKASTMRELNIQTFPN